MAKYQVTHSCGHTQTDTNMLYYAILINRKGRIIYISPLYNNRDQAINQVKEYASIPRDFTIKTFDMFSQNSIINL